MIDKELFKLIGKNKKYIFISVALQVLGLVANVGITASICWAIYLAITKAEPIMYLYPALKMRLRHWRTSPPCIEKRLPCMKAKSRSQKGK